MKFYALRKAGPLHNGAERGKGSIYHAVQALDGDNDTYPDRTAASGRQAVCGQQPAIMWSTRPSDAVTCPRCLKRLATPKQIDIVKELEQ